MLELLKMIETLCGGFSDVYAALFFPLSLVATNDLRFLPIIHEFNSLTIIFILWYRPLAYNHHDPQKISLLSSLLAYDSDSGSQNSPQALPSGG